MAKKKDENKVSFTEKFKGFFTGIANETKRIRWPKFSELMSNTAKVLVFCVLFALFFVLCDLVISGLLVRIGVGS